jgi:asparagine synthase (glutamine-hydrolysing)
MCGIAGWLGNMPGRNEQHAIAMAKALHHRGPDAHGIQSWPEATFVHTRLSIIDLSPTGAQPMANEDGGVWTVFNGEIYNHRQLQRYLESKGHRFKGRSDTEVLPHLYEEEGSQFVQKLRGMFALAIYDTRERALILARDRFGIKPLFYAPGRDCLAFASELRALLELPSIDTRPDKQAIYDLAALGYIPAPETLYLGIRALEPGEILEARFDGNAVNWNVRKYHVWSIAPDPAITLARAADRADELLSAAVERQLESDVPLGSLLSGGIDSSLVSAAAQRALGGELRTFNVQFSDKTHDETWAAEAVANHIRSRHETLDMANVRGTWDHVTGLLSHAGQPFADTSLFAVNAISRRMRQCVTVAISGDGGDEAFGGYDIYWRLARIARWQALPGVFQASAGMTLNSLSLLGVSSKRLAQRMHDLAKVDDTAVIQNLFCLMTERQHKDLVREINVLPVRRLFERQWQHQLPRQATRIERLSAYATEINVRLLLPNDFLFKVDIASMKESLEVRVPMLDEELFGFGLTLPHHLKVSGRTCKRTLRAVAAKRLPRAVANKPKWGFAVPLETWIAPDLKTQLRDVLLSSSSKLPDFFRPDGYKGVLDRLCNNASGSPSREVYRHAIMFLSVQLALGRKN